MPLDVSILDGVGDIRSFIVGAVAGSTFAWSFAQRTTVKFAKERIDNLCAQMKKNEETCEAEKNRIHEQSVERTQELKDYYKTTVDRLEGELHRLQKQVDTLQEHRLQMALLVDNDRIDLSIDEE